MGLTVEFERRANTDAKSGEKAETLKLDDSRKQWFLQNFSPLLSLHLIQLINCMRLCHGMEAVLAFLSNHRIRNYLTEGDWQWLVTLKACHIEKWKRDFPPTFISSVLSECNLDAIAKYGDVAMFTENTSEKFLSKNGTKDVIFSATGCCPFCTLPLKTIVSDTEFSIVVFGCGHAYHKVCLLETNLNHCVRCELERHRLRKQIDIALSRNGNSGFNFPSHGTLDNRRATNLLSNISPNTFKQSYAK